MTTYSTGNPARILVLVRRKSLLLAVLALAIFACLPSLRADSAGRLDKHARKMEKRLARFRTGALVQIDLRGSGEALGSLGNLSDDGTFQILSADSNTLLTFRYAEIDSVKKGKEYIGAGSEGHHVRLWVPVVVSAVVAGGGVAAYEVLH